MFPLLRCPELEIPLSFRGPGSLTELSLPPPMTTGWRACAGRMRASRPSPSFLGDPWIRLRRIWAAAGQREPFVLRKTNPARPDGPRPPSPGAAPAGRARPVAACRGAQSGAVALALAPVASPTEGVAGAAPFGP